MLTSCMSKCWSQTDQIAQANGLHLVVQKEYGRRTTAFLSLAIADSTEWLGAVWGSYWLYPRSVHCTDLLSAKSLED
jgi:hypothetical protein